MVKPHVILPLFLLTMQAESQDAKFYLTTEDGRGIPKFSSSNHFDCRTKIYGVLEYSNLSEGKHRYSVQWRDPSGKKREDPGYKFPVSNKVRPLDGATRMHNRVWVWIKVHHPTSGAKFGVLQPNFGRDRNLGKWTATAYLDGNQVGLLEFMMLCV